MVHYPSTTSIPSPPISTPCCAGSAPASSGADRSLAGFRRRLSVSLGQVPWAWLLLGLGVVIVGVAVLGRTLGLSVERLQAEALRNLWFMARESWSILPYFLLSVGLSAWAQITGFSGRVQAIVKQREGVAIAAAAAIGAVIPICSCSVLPLIAGLLAGGVPLGPVMAFWLSSPLMSPAMFVLTAGTLGTSYAVARLVTAVALGFAAGYAVSFLSARNRLRDPLRASPLLQTGCCTPSVPQTHGSSETPSIGKSFRTETYRASLFLGKWLLVAFFLQALIIHYVDPDWIKALLDEGRAFAIPLATVVGIPLYVSGIAAIPVVQGLVSSGMAPGAAMAFLIAGPMTTIPALVAVWALANRWAFGIYLCFGVGGSLVAGYVFQMIAH